MLTMAVQLAAKANFPNGVRITPYGTVEFQPNEMHGHDIKRGGIQDVAHGGAFEPDHEPDRSHPKASNLVVFRTYNC